MIRLDRKDSAAFWIFEGFFHLHKKLAQFLKSGPQIKSRVKFNHWNSTVSDSDPSMRKTLG